MTGADIADPDTIPDTIGGKTNGTYCLQALAVTGRRRCCFRGIRLRAGATSGGDESVAFSIEKFRDAAH
jgi:hypothetical protein